MDTNNWITVAGIVTTAIIALLAGGGGMKMILEWRARQRTATPDQAAAKYAALSAADSRARNTDVRLDDLEKKRSMDAERIFDLEGKVRAAEETTKASRIAADVAAATAEIARTQAAAAASRALDLAITATTTAAAAAATAASKSAETAATVAASAAKAAAEASFAVIERERAHSAGQDIQIASLRKHILDLERAISNMDSDRQQFALQFAKLTAALGSIYKDADTTLHPEATAINESLAELSLARIFTPTPPVPSMADVPIDIVDHAAPRG